VIKNPIDIIESFKPPPSSSLPGSENWKGLNGHHKISAGSIIGAGPPQANPIVTKQTLKITNQLSPISLQIKSLKNRKNFQAEERTNKFVENDKTRSGIV
jgi:hypothetical protein